MRIYTSCSDPLDFCRHCAPSEDEAEEAYGDVAKTGEGPDERGNCFGWDCDHPEYEDDPEMYRCAECGVELTEND